MSNASFELPNTEVVVIDGYKIDLSAGALAGQTLVYDAGANTFIAGDAYGTVSGSFAAQQVAYGTGTFTLAGSSNFIFDDGYNVLRVFGDGYVSQRMIINGSTAAISSSGTGAFRFNSGTNHLEFSEDGGSWTAFGTSLSIGGGVSGGTTKSVLFINSGNLAQDNTNFNYDNSTHKLTVSGHVSIDGYTIDLSAGAVSTQVLAFDGTSFVATNQRGGIGGTLTSTKVPYATGTSTLADSGMVWDNTNKILTVTTLAGNDGVVVTDGTRSLGLFVNYNSVAVGALGTTSNHNLVFFTNNSSAQVILSTGGQLGIGSSPSYALHVVGDGYVTSRSIINASSAAVSPSGTGAFRFNTGTNHLEFSENAGSWTQLGTGGGGGGTFNTTYSSTPANNIVWATTTGGPVIIRDNSNADSDVLFEVSSFTSSNDTTSPTPAGNRLVHILANGELTFSSKVNGTQMGVEFKPVVANRQNWGSYPGAFAPTLLIQGVTAGNGASSNYLAIGALDDAQTSSQILSTKGLALITGSNHTVFNATTAGLITFGLANTITTFNGYLLGDQNFNTPSFTTRSSGTKFITYNSLSGSSVDYAIGVESAAQWYSVQDASGSYSHRFYGGTTKVLDIWGDGSLQFNSSSAAARAGALRYNSSKLQGCNDGATWFDIPTSGGGGGFGTSGQKLISIVPAGFNVNNGTTTPLTVGAFRYNPNDYTVSATTQSVVFRAVAANGSGTVVGHVKLRDVTNGVDITTLNVTSGTTADTMFEQALTISSAGANTIANAATVYEVRIYVDSPVNVNDFIQLYSAEIRNIQTIN